MKGPGCPLEADLSCQNVFPLAIKVDGSLCHTGWFEQPFRFPPPQVFCFATGVPVCFTAVGRGSCLSVVSGPLLVPVPAA